MKNFKTNVKENAKENLYAVVVRDGIEFIEFIGD